jgi:uncharacterized protein (DUF934 family)
VFPGHERQCGFECRAVSVVSESDPQLKAIPLVSRDFPEFPPKRAEDRARLVSSREGD